MPNGAEARAGTTTTTCWKQHTTICNAGAPSVTSSGDILKLPTKQSNQTNCLIKNLLESESLPQIRNLLEMREINPARLSLKSGVENEADDEGAETDCGGDGRSLPQSGQEGERSNSERVWGADRLRA